jgi:hypothetical protein
MRNDPRELHNVYDDSRYSKIRDDLKEQLLRWFLATSDVTPYWFDSRRT